MQRGSTLNNNSSKERVSIEQNISHGNNAEKLIKRLGTFPRVTNVQMPQGESDNSQIQFHQDTSPTMRVSLNLYENENKNAKNISQSVKNYEKTTHLPPGYQSNTKVNDFKKICGAVGPEKPQTQKYQTQSQVQSARQSNLSQASKYEQMAQNFNLESLIKQAQMKRTTVPIPSQDSQHQQIQIQCGFTNKIDNFDGDNDQVDEEYESSAEKSKSISPTKQGFLYKQQNYKSPFDKLKQEEDSLRYDLSSDQKQYRLSFTPNQVISDRSAGDGSNQQSQNRIFSDLSAKVVNINSNFTALQNPFQSQINNQNQNQQNNNYYNKDQEQIRSNLDYEGAFNEHVNNTLSIAKHEQKYLQSELCNYDSIQVNRNNNNISPFDMLKQEYIAKKSEVLDKYHEIDAQHENEPEYQQEEDHDQYGQEEEEQQYQEEQEQEENSQEQEFYENEAENEEEQYINQQDKQSISPPHERKIQNAYQQELLYQEMTRKLNQNAPKQEPDISQSTQQFFDKLKVDKDQVNHANDIAARQTVPVPQEDRFLTFDDFVQRNSLKQKQESEQKQTQKQEINMNEYKSPRLNIDKNELQKREKDQENKKKREIEMLKQKAKEKEILREKRLKSAIMIQKWVRGHIQRKEFKKAQINFRYMRKFRRMMSIAYYKYRQKLLNQLLTTLKQIHQQKKSEEDDIYQQFMDHCVQLIQKTWRGYYARRYVIPDQIQEYKFNRQLIAIVKGWKIRRILNGCREVIGIKRELSDLQNQLRKANGPRDPIITSIMYQKRRKIEELIKVIPNLYRNGRWLFSQQKLLQNLKSAQKFANSKKNSMVGLQNYQFSQQNTQSKSQYLNNQQDNYAKNIKQKKQLNFNDDNDYNQYPPLQQQQQQQFQMPQQQQYATRNTQNQIFQTSDESQVVWPSKRLTSQKQTEEGVSIIWPSQKSQESEDQSVLMWPSKKNQKDNNEQLFNKTGQQLFSERFDDIPITQRTAVGDKMQGLDNQNQYQFKKQLENQYSHDEETQMIRKSPAKSPIKKQFLEDFDEMPIKPSNKNVFNFDLDEVPVGQSNQQKDLKENKQKQNFKQNEQKTNAMKKNPKFENDDFPLGSDDQEQEQVIEKPLQVQRTYQSNTFIEDSPIKPPTYNFEEMLEKALQDQPQAVGNQKKKRGEGSAVRRSKTTREQPIEDLDENQDEEQPKTKKDMKKQNLKKRQKYDPRKAIEEAKKQEVAKEKQQAKSAFPDGFLDNQTDRIRSQTSQPKVDNDDESTKQQKPQFNRKTQKQAQKEQEEQEKQQEATSEQQHSTNASSQGPKSFLKKKDREKPVIQGKVKWKVESRVSCWTNNKEARSNNQSLTRRKTSQLRSPKQNLPKQIEKPQQQQEEQKAKGLGLKKQKSIQEQTPPPPQKKSYSSGQPQSQQQQIRQQTQIQQPGDFQIKAQNVMQNVTLKNQQTPQLANQNNWFKQPQQMNHFVDDTIENESIPDENDLCDNQVTNQYTGFDMPLQITSQNLHTTQYKNDPQFQFTTSTGNQFYSHSIENQDQNDNITLQLEELEKVFEMFHPKVQCFEDSQIQESTRETQIPHMTLNSMFFSCYSDDIYDTILEDLREHYLQLCNE